MLKLLYKRLTQTQMIAVGFLAVILTGAVLLTLPISSKDGQMTNFLDALFTATSASCVTGLVVFNTVEKWSLFGQIVILGMIQIGGLGFMTVGVFFSIILRRKIGLRTRGILQESVNTMQIGGIVRLAKKITIGTLILEGIGAVILSFRFIRIFGFFRGSFYGIFHSISAFCNAGFDLMGKDNPYASFTGYADDYVINLTIMFLIVIGGIGFLVWDDIWTYKFKIRRYKLHTKIVLSTTAVLILGSAILFWILERGNTMEGMSIHGQILSSLFSSVTARTAGFNTIDTAALHDSSKLLTMVLMFVGGSPGSTAGGIKTTTLVVMLFYLKANMGQTQSCNIFGRRLGDEVIKKAGAVLCTNLFLSITAVIFLLAIQPLVMSDALFEVVSAIGTVGMSTGITRELIPMSKVVIIFLMYCGRIGSLSFALSLRGHKKTPPVIQPEEQIMVG